MGKQRKITPNPKMNKGPGYGWVPDLPDQCDILYSKQNWYVLSPPPLELTELTEEKSPLKGSSTLRAL